MGQSPDSLSYNSDSIGLPLVQGNADITDRVTTPTRFTSQPTKIAVEGDIIMSVRAPVGTVSVANQDVCCGRGVCSIRVKNNCLQEFLYQLLLLHEEDWRNVEQGGTFKAISGDDIRSFSVNIPSLSEQEKIASFLEKVDERIRIQKRIIETLKKYKRGLLDKLLEDNSSDANWHIVKLQDVANGFDYGMNSAATTFDGVHKYIRITDKDDDSRQYLSDDIVSPSDTPEEKYRVYDNDILFARTGASVGKSYLYTPEDGELYFAGFLIRISVKKEYNSYFVYLNTLTSKYEKWLRLESMRSGQPGVNAEQYRNYAFRCPDYQTQVKIASIIKGIDLRISKERMSLSKLNSLKNGLLQQLFI